MVHNRYIPLLLCLCILAVSAQAQAKSTRWSSELSHEQHRQMQKILHEAAPKIKLLRDGLQQKIIELKNFAYASPNDYETLALLGQELQNQRRILRQELKKLDEKLLREVGVSLHGYRGRDCNSLANEHIISESPAKKYRQDIPHHTE